jgi:YbbR domain-containing protein
MKRFATDQLGLKLVSLLLGVSLWFAVAREQGAEFAFTIPIELRDVPEGLEVVEETIQQVDVRVRGSSEILRRLTPQSLSVGIDLSDAEPGERVAYLSPEDVRAPFGVRVMRVTPTSVTLTLDRTLERTVQVIPRILGTPAAGFELFNIELNPREITVVGPASRVGELEQVTTEPVSADGLREPYSRTVRVELDPLVRLEGRTRVELTLDVREERARAEISGVPTRAEPRGIKVRLDPETVKVVAEGPRSVVESLTAQDLEAVVYLEGLAAGRHQVVPIVRVRRPEDLALVRVLSVQPKEVTARIE